MKIMSHEHLHCREFGSSLFSVEDFFKWLHENNLRILTDPDIKNLEFIQIEGLLCAIERAAGRVERDEALEIVKNDPSLINHRMAEINPSWLVGAESHRKWRVRINEAVSAGELVPLDYGSKLPIELPETTHTEKTTPTIEKPGITKGEVINAFNGLHFDRDQWSRSLADVPIWLKSSRISKGSKKHSATWNPALIAFALLGQSILVKKLDAVFDSLPIWLEEWELMREKWLESKKES